MQQWVGNCKVCDKQTELCCERCRDVFYCSIEHQRQDWEDHRNQCIIDPESQMVKVEDIRLVEGQEGQSVGGDGVSQMPSSPKIQQQNSETQAKEQAPQDIQLLLQKERIKAKEVKSRGEIMKKMIESRNAERQSTLFYYFKKNMQSAVITGKRVLLLSRRLASQFQNSIHCEELENRFLLRTNKLLQDIEILMDTSIIARIYLSMQKQEELKHLLNPSNLIFPAMRQCPFPDTTKITGKKQMAEYNIWKEEITKMSAILNTLILISSKIRLVETTESLFLKYRKLVNQYVGQLETGTVEFQWGIYCQQAGLMEKAHIHFLQCLKIRQKYGQSLPLSDVLYNLGLVQFYNNPKDKSEAIGLVQQALRIRRQRIAKPSLEYVPLLETLGKFCMESFRFPEAFRYFFESLKICRCFLDPKDKTKKRSEVLLIFLYKTIQNQIKQLGSSAPAQYATTLSDIDQNVFVLQEFDGYLIHDTKKEDAHFILDIPRDFYDMLTSDEAMDLYNIKEQLKNLNYRQGIQFLCKTNFYKTLNAEKKALFNGLHPALNPVEAVLRSLFK